MKYTYCEVIDHREVVNYDAEVMTVIIEEKINQQYYNHRDFVHYKRAVTCMRTKT